MRSLFAKFFLCMLLVPVLARGGGLILAAAFDEPRLEAERVLGKVLPLFVPSVSEAVDRGGPAAAATLVAPPPRAPRPASRCESRHNPPAAARRRWAAPWPFRSRRPRARRGFAWWRPWLRTRAFWACCRIPGGLCCR